jgi:chaperone required for assembly of F1-ATPase
VKRFYASAEAVDAGDGFAVALDGRRIKTPSKAALIVPRRGLAEALAAEWQAQGEEILPHTMGLTRLANTAIDGVRGRRAKVIAEVAGFAATDLVCYRAVTPPELVACQDAAWRPLLDWMAGLGVRLAVTSGVAPIAQPAAALKTIGDMVAAHDDFPLTALHAASAVGGSAVIALALAHGEIGAAAAGECATVDDGWQIERWGDDDEAVARLAAVRAEFAAAARFLELCRPPP